MRLSASPARHPASSTSITRRLTFPMRSTLLAATGASWKGSRHWSTTRASSWKAQRLSLTANVVTTAIRLRLQLRAHSSKPRRNCSPAEEKQVALIERQFELGGWRDCYRNHAAHARSSRRVPCCRPWNVKLSQTRHQLAVLSGRLPSERGAARVRSRRYHPAAGASGEHSLIVDPAASGRAGRRGAACIKRAH